MRCRRTSLRGGLSRVPSLARSLLLPFTLIGYRRRASAVHNELGPFARGEEEGGHTGYAVHTYGRGLWLPAAACWRAGLLNCLPTYTTGGQPIPAVHFGDWDATLTAEQGQCEI